MRALTLASLLLLPLLASADVPRRMTWHGRLARADGSPETSPQTLKFALYPAASGGAALWEETLQNVPVVNGAYAVVLGQASPLPASVVNGQDLYLGLSLNGTAELQPRVRVASVPYALTAGDAHALEGHPAADFALTTHSHPNASSNTAGFLSAADKSKLDGLDGASYAPAGHGHADVNASAPGFMSVADKTKLDGLNAASYAPVSHVHSSATGSTAGFLSAADKSKLDGLDGGSYAPVVHGHSNATPSTPGFMSGSDKTKLDRYPSTPAALACTYRRTVASGGGSTATAKCATTEMLLGSTCATLDNGGTLLSGSEPLGVTASSSSTGDGIHCLGTGSGDTDEVHAWVFCCKL